MSTELFYLTLTALLTGCLWIPYVIGLVQARGLPKAHDYVHAPTSELPDWVNRANRAHLNAVENLAPFAVLVLVAHDLGISTQITAMCATIFFFARLLHALVHIGGVSMLKARTLIFTVGWLCFIVFAVETLRSV